MTDNEEITWAKLNGNWDDANYRYELAKEGRCLRVLSHDINKAVQKVAHDKFVNELFRKSTIRTRDGR